MRCLYADSWHGSHGAKMVELSALRTIAPVQSVCRVHSTYARGPRVSGDEHTAGGVFLNQPEILLLPFRVLVPRMALYYRPAWPDGHATCTWPLSLQAQLGRGLGRGCGAGHGSGHLMERHLQRV